jgi:hypothetical protein
MNHDEDPQGHVRPDAGAAGHEPSEVGIRKIFIFGGVLAGLILVAMLLLRGMMLGFSAEEKKDGTTTADLVRQRPGDFPTPRLQRDTTYDLVEFRKQEDDALSSYGWEDPKAGIARIPISRAIDILAEKGLPRPKPTEKRPAPAETKPAQPKPSASEPGKKE